MRPAGRLIGAFLRGQKTLLIMLQLLGLAVAVAAGGRCDVLAGCTITPLYGMKLRSEAERNSFLMRPSNRDAPVSEPRRPRCTLGATAEDHVT
jgi:hypothetical protein